jgi:hypothetical protein
MICHWFGDPNNVYALHKKNYVRMVDMHGDDVLKYVRYTHE